jgi:hypothetical protein
MRVILLSGVLALGVALAGTSGAFAVVGAPIDHAAKATSLIERTVLVCRRIEVCRRTAVGRVCKIERVCRERW